MNPGEYAAQLLDQLGHDGRSLTTRDTRSETDLWSDSGARYLTGNPDGPSLPSPAPLACAARGTWLALAELGGGALDPEFPAHRLLGERAALLGLERRGRMSPGGVCRLLDCADGTLALNLAREDDWHLLHPWLQSPANSWDAVRDLLPNRSCQDMVDRARLLGLAAAVSRPPEPPDSWYRATRLARANEHPNAPLVIDLSSIWAGPLCGQLLGQLGARVIKVESTTRPDGARRGMPAFFDLLNGDKQSVALDLTTDTGRRQLRQLLALADIVIESSRPRALEQMDIHAADIVARGSGCTWLSITGYGREAPMGQWIAYGDDAGVAAGLSYLISESGGNPVFCGDAIADPLTGLHAALLAWSAWQQGGGVLLDVPLTGVLGHIIAMDDRSGEAPGAAREVALPCARPPGPRAPEPGRDTRTVLAELGIGH